MVKTLKYILLSIVTLISVVVSRANQPLDQPQVHCIAVDAAGDVTITWGPVTDPFGIFDQYEVYDDAGTLVSTVGTIGSTSATIAGAGANTSSQCFYVVAAATSAQYDSPQSRDICSIFLDVVNPGDGTAILSWNNISNPMPASNDGWYRIYREYPAGTWTMIDSVAVPTTFTRDTITICDSWLDYRIELESSFGCASVSNVDGEQFEDLLSPEEPVINSVSVDTSNGMAVIDWEPSGSMDTEGYILLQFIPGSGWVIIDTIWGYNNTIYTNGNSTADMASEGYGLAAFDSCWSGTPATPNTSPMGTPHWSIWLRSATDVCGQRIHLTWSPYRNWPNGVQSYKIFASENGGPFNQVGSNSGGDTTFTHSGLNTGSTYTYVIRAENVQGVDALSNKVDQVMNGPVQPTFGYLRTATVMGEESVRVRYQADQAASVSHYRLERSTSLNGTYQEVDLAYPGANPISFTDADAATRFSSYFYRVITVDSCGNDAHTSNIGKTILLTVVENTDYLENNLSWTAYEGWDGVVVEYNIYRSVDGVFDPTPIATVPSTNTSYTDNVEDLLETSGEFCYYIEAVESPNSFGIDEISLSNTACAYQEPLVWIPNAMVINGYNTTFKAEAGYVPIDSYTMRIFDRWGQLLFETSDINEAWDGTYRGNFVTEDVYVYHISYNTADGSYVERQGTVTVLKK